MTCVVWVPWKRKLELNVAQYADADCEASHDQSEITAYSLVDTVSQAMEFERVVMGLINDAIDAAAVKPEPNQMSATNQTACRPQSEEARSP